MAADAPAAAGAVPPVDADDGEVTYTKEWRVG
jgi:hypothetical protein